MSRVGWVGLAVVVACVGTPASATADRSERLDQLRTEIEQRESRAQAYREEAEGASGRWFSVATTVAPASRATSAIWAS